MLRLNKEIVEGVLCTEAIEVICHSHVFQLAMVLTGYTLRGAVGPLYIDEDLAWGSGLLAAVQAEQESARDLRCAHRGRC